jgi:CRISPR-associated protein Cas2
LVEGVVGGGEQVAEVAPGVGDGGDADGDGHLQVRGIVRVAVDRDGDLGDFLAEPFGDLMGFLSDGVRHEEGEFFAAEPARDVIVTQQRTQSAGNRGEVMLCVITYDIADDRRRENVATLLSGYGPRVQLSVFECELPTRREAGQLRGLIDPVEDQIRMYPLDRSYG